MVDAWDLPELQRVDDQADIAVGREPHAMILKRGLVAVTASSGMAADVQDRRGRELGVLGQVEVAGDVQAGAGLEVEVLDGEGVGVDLAGDRGLEVGPRRQRVQAAMQRAHQRCDESCAARGGSFHGTMMPQSRSVQG